MLMSSYVRRVSSVLLIFFLVAGFFVNKVDKALAFSTLDQHVDTADGYWRILSHQMVGQTFRPTLNKLDGLGAYTGIQPSGPNSCTITVTLFKNNTPPIKIAEKTQTIYKMETYTIIDIPAVNMVPDARYTMYLTASSPYAYWLTKLSDVYPRGTAIVDSVTDASSDFVFATFGYNDTPPEIPSEVPVVDVSPEPTGGDSGTTTSESGTTSATDSSTSSTSSISAPTSLAATVVTEGTASLINLTWTASKTTAITGYRIYRSVSSTSDFAEIGTTDKATLNFKDTTAVANQTYYYAVRAYKDTAQSKNSNIVSSIITDTTAPTKPVNFKITSSNENEIAFSWDKNPDADVANYILTVAESDSADAKILATVESIGKDETSYTLMLANYPELKTDTNYTFYLQARDTNMNMSEKAVTSGMFAKVKEATNIWLWIWIAAGIILAAGIIAAIIIIRKKKAKRIV